MTQDNLIIASIARLPASAESMIAAELIRSGAREAQVPMIGGYTELLGALACSHRVLSEGCATVEQRDAAAQHLIQCHHTPWRVLAARHLIGRKGVPAMRMGGVA